MCTRGALAGQWYTKQNNQPCFLAHLSRRLRGELIVYHSSRRPWVRASTFSNMNISETNRPIAIKFNLNHHWGREKASVGFDPDHIRALVSMATDSSHSYNGKNGVIKFSRMFLIGYFSLLQVTMTCMRIWMSSKFRRIRQRTTDLAALEHMKKIP